MYSNRGNTSPYQNVESSNKRLLEEIDNLEDEIENINNSLFALSTSLSNKANKTDTENSISFLSDTADNLASDLRKLRSDIIYGDIDRIEKAYVNDLIVYKNISAGGYHWNPGSGTIVNNSSYLLPESKCIFFLGSSRNGSSKSAIIQYNADDNFIILSDTDGFVSYKDGKFAVSDGAVLFYIGNFEVIPGTLTDPVSTKAGVTVVGNLYAQLASANVNNLNVVTLTAEEITADNLTVEDKAEIKELEVESETVGTSNVNELEADSAKVKELNTSQINTKVDEEYIGYTIIPEHQSGTDYLVVIPATNGTWNLELLGYFKATIVKTNNASTITYSRTSKQALSKVEVKDNNIYLFTEGSGKLYFANNSLEDDTTVATYVENPPYEEPEESIELRAADGTVNTGSIIVNDLTVTGDFTVKDYAADKLNTEENESEGTFYPTFVDSNNTGKEPEDVYTSRNISIDPYTGTLTSCNAVVSNDLTVGNHAEICGDIDACCHLYVGESAHVACDLNVGGCAAVSCNVTVDGDVTIAGDLCVAGTEYVTDVEYVKSCNDKILLRDGNDNPIAAGELSGIEVNKYDGTSNTCIGVDNTGTLRIGDCGTCLQPVMTRAEESSLTNNGLLVWDATNKRAVNNSGLVYCPTNGKVYVCCNSTLGYKCVLNESDLEDLDLTLAVETTYSCLLSCVNCCCLTPGQMYIITDYATTTTQVCTYACNNICYDVIVCAVSCNKLNENARARIHNGCADIVNTPSAWSLKYTIYNDADHYGWADTANGKGVVYYICDKFNNELYYDFFNIGFIQKIVNTTVCGFLFNESSNLWSIVTNRDCYDTYSHSLHIPNGTDCIFNNKLGDSGGCRYNIPKNILGKTQINNNTIKCFDLNIMQCMRLNTIDYVYNNCICTLYNNSGNHLSGNCIVCMVDNIINAVSSNTINTLYYNTFAGYFMSNKAIYMHYNTISGNAACNCFDYFCQNTVNGTMCCNCIRQACHNIIGSNFCKNNIGCFYYNNVGVCFAFNTAQSTSFIRNTIGTDFKCNCIYASVTSNVIGNVFYANCITQGAPFSNNTIGNSFNQNRLCSPFGNNSVSDNVYHNCICTCMFYNCIESNFICNFIGKTNVQPNCYNLCSITFGRNLSGYCFDGLTALNCWSSSSGSAGGGCTWYCSCDTFPIFANMGECISYNDTPQLRSMQDYFYNAKQYSCIDSCEFLVPLVSMTVIECCTEDENGDEVEWDACIYTGIEFIYRTSAYAKHCVCYKVCNLVNNTTCTGSISLPNTNYNICHCNISIAGPSGWTKGVLRVDDVITNTAYNTKQVVSTVITFLCSC